VMPAMSCDRNGAAMTSRSSPVPAWNNASMSAIPGRLTVIHLIAPILTSRP
jgi:hypothetical protein